jgi:hypothetical protein
MVFKRPYEVNTLKPVFWEKKTVFFVQRMHSLKNIWGTVCIYC